MQVALALDAAEPYSVSKPGRHFVQHNLAHGDSVVGANLQLGEWVFTTSQGRTYTQKCIAESCAVVQDVSVAMGKKLITLSLRPSLIGGSTVLDYKEDYQEIQAADLDTLVSFSTGLPQRSLKHCAQSVLHAHIAMLSLQGSSNHVGLDVPDPPVSMYVECLKAKQRPRH